MVAIDSNTNITNKNVDLSIMFFKIVERAVKPPPVDQSKYSGSFRSSMLLYVLSSPFTMASQWRHPWFWHLPAFGLMTSTLPPQMGHFFRMFSSPFDRDTLPISLSIRAFVPRLRYISMRLNSFSGFFFGL